LIPAFLAVKAAQVAAARAAFTPPGWVGVPSETRIIHLFVIVVPVNCVVANCKAAAIFAFAPAVIVSISDFTEL